MSSEAEQATLNALMNDELNDTVTNNTTDNKSDNESSDSDDDNVNIVLNSTTDTRTPRLPRYQRKPAEQLTSDSTTAKTVIQHPFLTHPNEKVYELDIDSIEDKKWRQPNVDITDYFNYGFNETTFKAYAQLQLNLRNGVDPNKVKQDTIQTVQQPATLPTAMPTMPLPLPFAPLPLQYNNIQQQQQLYEQQFDDTPNSDTKYNDNEPSPRQYNDRPQQYQRRSDSRDRHYEQRDAPYDTSYRGRGRGRGRGGYYTDRDRPPSDRDYIPPSDNRDRPPPDLPRETRERGPGRSHSPSQDDRRPAYNRRHDYPADDRDRRPVRQRRY